MKKRPVLLFVSAAIFLLIVTACLMAPLLTDYSVEAMDLQHIVEPPSREHLLGTDYFGRDIFTRFLYGGRVTLRISLIAFLITLLAIPLGLFSGYKAGAFDIILSRIFDGLSAIPPLLLIVFAETLLGYGKGYYQYALGIAFMPPLFRLTRTLTMDVSGKEFIEAARSLGASHFRLIFKHILRNILPDLITQLFSTASDIMIYCTILGYLEIGVKSPTPEWGAIIHDMFAYVYRTPLTVVLTSSILAICVLSIHLFGRSLRDRIAGEENASTGL